MPKDIEVFVLVENPNGDGHFEVCFRASKHQSFENIKKELMRRINSTGQYPDLWGDDEEIIIYWREKLKSRYHKVDRSFSDIDGLIVNGRVTFKVAKLYPGGCKITS